VADSASIARRFPPSVVNAWASQLAWLANCLVKYTSLRQSAVLRHAGSESHAETEIPY
jgi:hypothetical protein